MLFDNSTIWYESHYMISLQCDLDQDLSDGGATLEFRAKTYYMRRFWPETTWK